MLYPNTKKEPTRKIKGMRITVGDLSDLERQFLPSVPYSNKKVLDTTDRESLASIAVYQLPLWHIDKNDSARSMNM